MTTYKNPFFSPKHQSTTGEFITSEAEPQEYKGFQIFKHSEREFHIVKDGICVAMCAGSGGAFRRADELANGYILEDMRQLAERAHAGTSFDPEKRAESIIRDYSKELSEDLQSIPEDLQSEYKANYRMKLGRYLSARSKVMSPMITGPARFPVARMEKLSRFERNAYEAFRGWREYKLNQIKKAILAARTPDQVEADLWEKAKKSFEGHISAIIEIDNKVTQYNRQLFVMAIRRTMEGFAANGRVEFIKRCDELLKEASIKHERPIIKQFSIDKYLAIAESVLVSKQNTPATKKEEIAGIEFVINGEIERVQIFFPTKEIAMQYKDAGYLSGWNWSPSNKAWQRKSTDNGIRSLQRLKEITAGTLPKEVIQEPGKITCDLGCVHDVHTVKTVDEANRFMEQNTGYGVLREDAEGIHLAKI